MNWLGKTLFTTIILQSYFGVSGQQKANLKSFLNVEIEFLEPTKSDRNINTFSSNFLFGWERFPKTPLTFGIGLTATYAWGEITQLNEKFEDVIYENNALGLGPIFNISFEPFVYKGFSFSPYLTGGLILYSEKFPHGGDIYNFMWRAGGSFHYRINNEYKINFSTIWMHVSNGQGINQGNPSYEGFGFNLSLSKYLKE